MHGTNMGRIVLNSMLSKYVIVWKNVLVFANVDYLI